MDSMSFLNPIRKAMSSFRTLLLISLLTIFCGQAFSQNKANIGWRCQSTIVPASPIWLIHYKKTTYTLDSVQAKRSVLNPDYLENVQVLKDVAATALYGSRAASGITIITLKKRYAKAEIKRLKPYLTKF
jgi:TonB-dependent SusC/RagA subfamily outer membrane receptor